MTWVVRSFDRSSEELCRTTTVAGLSDDAARWIIQPPTPTDIEDAYPLTTDLVDRLSRFMPMTDLATLTTHFDSFFMRE